MIDTAGTTTAAIETLYENGAKEVYVAATSRRLLYTGESSSSRLRR